MLISLIIAFFLLHGGSAAIFSKHLDQLETRIKKEVTVDSTKKQALALVNSVQAANKSLLDERKKYLESAGKVFGDRTSTAAQINAAVLPLLTADSATTERIVDMYVSLRPVLGAAEWMRVVAPPPSAPSK